MELHKMVCGNCKLRSKDGKCSVDDRKEKEDKIACFLIHKNFEDRGFTSEVLSPYKEESKPRREKEVQEVVSTSFCLECNERLIFQEGCNHCPSCGYTKC